MSELSDKVRDIEESATRMHMLCGGILATLLVNRVRGNITTVDDVAFDAMVTSWRKEWDGLPDADPLTRMVDRFLGWRLPEDFGPDAGISFDRTYVDKWGMPIGTNLFTADQARGMIMYLLELPKP